MHLSRLGPLIGAALLLPPVLSGCSESLPTSGPVQFEGADLDQWSYVRADKGDTVVFGALLVRNDGKKTASLAEARLTGPGEKVYDEGATISEVKVRDVSGGQELVGAAQWPFEHYADDAVDLDGFELKPGGSAELLFIVKVDEEGHWFWPTSELTYSVDGDKWEAKASTGFLICPSDRDRECDEPTGKAG